jgi:hypothetical protein
LRSYSIKLLDVKEDDKFGYTIRNAVTSVSGASVGGLVKIPKYCSKKLSVTSPIREILITLTLSEIIEIDGKNEKRNAFISDRISAKLSSGLINVVFVRISRADGAGFTSLKSNIDKIAEFVVDMIYKHPKVEIVSLPYMEFLKNDSPDDLIEFDSLIRERISQITNIESGTGKIGYFLPSYYTREKIPELVENYASKFGSNGLFICDLDGATFSSVGYSVISQVARKIENEHGEENYSLYAFSLKEKKSSGNEAPAEDILALLSQASIVGPSHKRRILPKDIVKKLKENNEFNPKILEKDDYLYYQYLNYYGSKKLDEWFSTHFNKESLTNEKKRHFAELYNSQITMDTLRELASDPDDSIKKLKREEFSDILKYIGNKRKKIER